MDLESYSRFLVIELWKCRNRREMLGMNLNYARRLEMCLLAGFPVAPQIGGYESSGMSCTIIRRIAHFAGCFFVLDVQ